MTIRLDYLTIVTLVMLILRLTETIMIPWGWVFAPLWAPVVFVGAVLAGIAILSVVSFVLNMLGTKR